MAPKRRPRCGMTQSPWPTVHRGCPGRGRAGVRSSSGDEIAQVALRDLFARVGHADEALIDLLEPLFGEVESDFREPVLQAVPSAAGGEDDLALFRADQPRIDDFVSGALFQDPVLV